MVDFHYNNLVLLQSVYNFLAKSSYSGLTQAFRVYEVIKINNKIFMLHNSTTKFAKTAEPKSTTRPSGS